MLEHMFSITYTSIAISTVIILIGYSMYILLNNISNLLMNDTYEKYLKTKLKNKKKICIKRLVFLWLSWVSFITLISLGFNILWEICSFFRR